MTPKKHLEVLKRLVNNPETYGTFGESGDALQYALQAIKENEELEAKLKALEGRIDECDHDWQQEWYDTSFVTSNTSEKHWRCKKCLITRITYD